MTPYFERILVYHQFVYLFGTESSCVQWVYYKIWAIILKVIGCGFLNDLSKISVYIVDTHKSDKEISFILQKQDFVTRNE